MSPKALEGIKVVELGDYISAPFCARLLADLGAEVIKIEPPYGSDSSRRNGPFPFVQEDGQEDGDGPNAEASGLFLFLNTGKMGITLDVTTPTGRDMLLQLLEEADILVENHSPGHIEQLKLDYPSLKERFPRLIVTSISPFGQTGPYKDYAGYDLNVQAAGGISIGIGMPDREPLAIPLSQADYMAGLAGAASTLIALLARDVTGRGQLVDVSESQVLAVLISFVYFLPNFIYRGVAGTRKGKRGGEAYFPNTIMPCKDGFVCLYPLQIHQYLRLLKLMGDPDWQENPRYRNRRANGRRVPQRGRGPYRSLVPGAHQGGDFQLCMEAKVPCVPVRTIEEVANDPHLRERGFFTDVNHPIAGLLSHPGSPLRLSQTPGEIGGPAPLLGQHNVDILCGRLGISREELQRLRMAGIL